MDNLVSVELPSGMFIEYAIDGLGRRVGKKLNGSLVRQWLYGKGRIRWRNSTELADWWPEPLPQAAKRARQLTGSLLGAQPPGLSCAADR